MDMQGLNLFGVSVDQGADQYKDVASSKDTQQILQDLIDLTDQFDNNELANFNNRKSFAYYDVSTH
jgi:hypothetical protein